MKKLRSKNRENKTAVENAATFLNYCRDNTNFADAAMKMKNGMTIVDLAERTLECAIRTRKTLAVEEPDFAKLLATLAKWSTDAMVCRWCLQKCETKLLDIWGL